MNMSDHEPSAWQLDEPAVTTLIVLSPPAQLLESPQQLGRAIADAIGRDVELSTPDELPEDVPWMAIMHIEDLAAPLMCWPEPQAAEGTGLEEELAHPHGLLVQTLLHPADPLTSMANLLRLLTISAPDTAGVLDADTGRWLPRALLHEQLVSTDIDPSEELLWIVEATSDDTSHHLQTCGLKRCGHRELALNDISSELVDPAADLLASLAALVLETPLPAAGAIEVGPDLHLGVHGTPDQEDAMVKLTHAEHKGPPEEVLQQLAEDVTAVYRSQRSGLRQTAMAVATWDKLLELYPLLTKADATCYLEVPFEDDSGQDDRRVHLWMEVVEQRDLCFMAIPAHEAGPWEDMSDTPIQIEATEICSWRVVHNEVAYGPEQCDELMALFQGEASA